jgi:hypothetical protein
MKRATRITGLVGFALWVIIVVGLAIVGVLVGRQATTPAALCGVLGLVLGVALVWFLFRPPFIGKRVPAVLGSGGFTGAAIAAVLPKSDGVVLFFVGLGLGLLTPPLAKYLFQMSVGHSRSERQQVG